MHKWFIVLALAVVLVGCHGVVRKDFDADGNAAGLQVGDPALKAIVKIVQADSQFVDGYLKVRILLHNRTPLRRELEWKIVFSDEQGFPLDDPWGWRPLNLEPGGDEVIEVTALSREAATFQLQMQRASMEDLR